MENMNSERKYLLQRVLDLTKQLDMAQNTISSLENINVCGEPIKPIKSIKPVSIKHYFVYK